MFINQDPDLTPIQKPLDGCVYCCNLKSGDSLDLSPDEHSLESKQRQFCSRLGKYCPFCGRKVRLHIWL